MWTEPHHDANVWFLTHDEKCLWAACTAAELPTTIRVWKFWDIMNTRNVKYSNFSAHTTTVWKKKRIHKQIFWMSTWFASIILFLLFYHIILWLLAFHWIYFHACMRREQEEDWIKRNETNEMGLKLKLCRTIHISRCCEKKKFYSLSPLFEN